MKSAWGLGKVPELVLLRWKLRAWNKISSAGRRREEAAGADSGGAA